MEILGCMASTKDQTSFLASGCNGAAILECIVVGMTVVVESTINSKEASICRRIFTLWRKWYLIWRPRRFLTLNN